MPKGLTYRQCKTAEDFARFDAEVKALEDSYAKAAEHERKREAEWWAAHPEGPTAEDLEVAEYEKYLEKERRIFNMGRI